MTLLFMTKLFIVWEMLPFTPSAYREVSTSGSDPAWRRFAQTLDMAFSIRTLFFVYLKVNYITRSAIGQKDNYLAFIFRAHPDPGESFAFCGNPCYLNFVEKRQILLFSSHRVYINMVERNVLIFLRGQKSDIVIHRNMTLFNCEINKFI